MSRRAACRQRNPRANRVLNSLAWADAKIFEIRFPFGKATRIEEARIRAAYAKRHNDNVRYSCFDRAQLFMIQERERQILSSLQQHGFERLAKKSLLEIGCGTGYWICAIYQMGSSARKYYRR